MSDTNLTEQLEDIRLAIQNLNMRQEHQDRQDAEQDLSIKKLQSEQVAAKRVDWKLWLTIVGMIAGGIWSGWMLISNQMEKAVASTEKSLNLRIVSVEKDLGKLDTKITDEVEDREADVARIDRSLEARQEWMTEVNRAMARSDVREEQVRTALEEFGHDRYKASDHEKYDRHVESRFDRNEKEIGELYDLIRGK